MSVLTYQLIGKNLWLFVDGVKAANFGNNQGALTKVIAMESGRQRELAQIERLKEKIKTFERISELSGELHDECEKIWGL